MPAISADNLAWYRTSQHACLLALACYAPAAIWTAQLNGAHSQGATALAVDGVSQVRAPATDYLVCFGSAAGARDLGTARFRSYAAPTLTVDAHNALLPDDAYVTVFEEIKPEARHPAIDDNDVVSENGNVPYGGGLNEQFPPLARIGCAPVATIDPDTGLATVRFWADPDPIAPGATIAGGSWDFRDGTVVLPGGLGTIASPLHVTYPSAGARYITYVCTDSNGKTGTRCLPVYVFDDAHPAYTQLEIDNAESDRQGGAWRVTVKVYTNAPTSSFPNQALVTLFARDWYGGGAGLIGNMPWRENIVLQGYIRKGSTKRSWSGGYVQFDIESVAGVMGNLWGLAGGLESTAGTPSGWHQLKALDHNLAAHHLLVHHSTISQIADVHLNLLTYPTEYLDLPEASLAEQLRSLCAPVRGEMGSSAEGSLYLESNPQLLPLASRSTTYVLSTTDADLRDEIEFGEEEQEEQRTQIDFQGEDASAEPLFSLAPATPWPMGQSERVENVRVADQAEANVVAGLFEGERNNSFNDVILAWRGTYRAVPDIFPAEPLAVNADPAKNRRGLSWTNQRCWTRRKSYEYRPGGILLVTSVVAKDSYGHPGITGDYPPVVPPIPPPLPPEPPPVVLPPTPPPPSTGDGSRVYVGTDAGVAYCNNFLTAPTWTAANTGLAGDALKVFKFYFDPWSSGATELQKAYIVTKAGVYKNSALPSGAWSCVLSKAQATALLGWATITFARHLVLPINVENYIGLWVYGGDGVLRDTLYWVYSLDGGVTWQANTANYIVGELPDAKGYNSLQAWPSHKTAGTFYTTISCGQWWGGNTAETLRLFKTVDAGLHWVDLGPTFFAAGAASAHHYVMPFANGSGAAYGDDKKAWRRRFQLLEYTANFPGAMVFNTDDYTVALNLGGVNYFGDFDLCTWDEDYVYALDATNGKVYATTTGGAPWTAHTCPAEVYALSCLPSNAEFCAVAGPTSGAHAVWIELTVNGGVAWADRTGDLAAVLPAAHYIHSIVPDWVKVAS